MFNKIKQLWRKLFASREVPLKRKNEKDHRERKNPKEAEFQRVRRQAINAERPKQFYNLELKRWEGRS